jgi:putative adhesin
MANSNPRDRSLFPGLALLFVGLLLLVHNYRGLDIRHLLGHWWPLLIIFWGVIKLYERGVASRSGQPSASPITAGEVFLVLGLLSLLGIVVAVDLIKNRLPMEEWPARGDSFGFDLNLEPKAVLPDSRITIHNTRGDVTVRSSDEAQIRVDGKKNIKAWSEKDAEHIASAISVEIAKNGDAYEIRPVNAGRGDSRVGLNMEIAVPKKASLTIRDERGDVSVSDMNKPVVVSTTRGDVEVRDTVGDVTVDTGKGDVKVSDTKGNVKISGHGGEVNVSSASGGLTIDGEFYGPIRADKIAKGVRFVSQRTDLTLTQLSGHMEAGSGNLEIADAPGNLTLRTNSYDVSIENASGKVKVDNRNGNVEVRFSLPPKEDIEISNSSAPITLSLPESSSFEINADCHSCDVDSEFSADSLKKTSTQSDSHMEGKYGNGRGPKITLKTSYGAISIRKTS